MFTVNRLAKHPWKLITILVTRLITSNMTDWKRLIPTFTFFKPQKAKHAELANFMLLVLTYKQHWYLDVLFIILKLGYKSLLLLLIIKMNIFLCPKLTIFTEIWLFPANSDLYVSPQAEKGQLVEMTFSSETNCFDTMSFWCCHYFYTFQPDIIHLTISIMYTYYTFFENIKD